MARTVLTTDDMEVLGEGGWVNLYRLQTASGPREVIARRNGSFRAAKMLLMRTSSTGIDHNNFRGEFARDEFVRRLRLLAQDFFVATYLLAVDRPITYFDSPDLAQFGQNYQLELPGGIKEGGESDLLTATREACEEMGLGQDDIVASAPLCVAPMANDSGGQVEVYTISTAMTTKSPSPPNREGIVQEACCEVPLEEALNTLEHDGNEILTEALTHLAIARLLCELGPIDTSFLGSI